MSLLISFVPIFPSTLSLLLWVVSVILYTVPHWRHFHIAAVCLFWCSVLSHPERCADSYRLGAAEGLLKGIIQMATGRLRKRYQDMLTIKLPHVPFSQCEMATWTRMVPLRLTTVRGTEPPSGRCHLSGCSEDSVCLSFFLFSLPLIWDKLDVFGVSSSQIAVP